MENKDFTLKSGHILHVNDAPWEKVVPLWSAVQMASQGQLTNPEVGRLILASKSVQDALAELYPCSTWNNIQITPALFNEVKNGPLIRVDQPEIWESLMHFHLRFFLTNSSLSTDSKKAPIESQKQP